MSTSQIEWCNLVRHIIVKEKIIYAVQVMIGGVKIHAFHLDLVLGVTFNSDCVCSGLLWMRLRGYVLVVVVCKEKKEFLSIIGC